MEPDKISNTSLSEQSLSSEVKSELVDYIAQEQDLKAELLNKPIQSAEFDPSTNQIIVTYYGQDGQKPTTQKIQVKEYQKLKDHIFALQLGNTAEYNYLNQAVDYATDVWISVMQSEYQNPDTPYGNLKDQYMLQIEKIKQYKYQYMSQQAGLRHGLRYGLDGVTAGNYRDKLDSLTAKYVEGTYATMRLAHDNPDFDRFDTDSNPLKGWWNMVRGQNTSVGDLNRVDEVFEHIKKVSKNFAVDDRSDPKRFVYSTKNKIAEAYRDGIFKLGHTNSDNAAELKENEIVDSIDYYKGMKDVLEIFNPIDLGGDFLTMVEGRLPGGYTMGYVSPFSTKTMVGGPTVENAKKLADTRGPWQKSKDYQIAQLKKSGIPHATAVKKVEAFMGDGKQSYRAYRLWYLSSRPQKAIMNGKAVMVRKNGISLIQAEKIIAETQKTYNEIKSQESDRYALKQTIKETYFDSVVSNSEARVGLPAGMPKMVKIGDWEKSDPKNPSAKNQAIKNLTEYYKMLFPKGRMTTPYSMAEDIISKMRSDQMRYGAYAKFKDMSFGSMLENRRVVTGKSTTHTMGGSYSYNTYGWSDSRETKLNNIIGGIGAISDKKSVEYAKMGYGFAVSLAAMWATGGIMGRAGLTTLGTVGAEAAIAARTAGLLTRYRRGRTTLNVAAEAYQSGSTARAMLQVAGQITAEGLAFHAISTPISNVLNGVGDITLGMTDRMALAHSVGIMFGMKLFGKYLQFTKENLVSTTTATGPQVLQAAKLLGMEVGVLTGSGAAIDFAFDQSHPWSFEDMIHTVLTIVALKKAKFLQKVSPDEIIVIKKKFNGKNKTIEFVKQLNPSKFITTEYQKAKTQIGSSNQPVSSIGKVVETTKVVGRMAKNFLFEPTDVEVTKLKQELEVMQYKSDIMEVMGERVSNELNQFTEQDKQDLNSAMEQAKKDISAKIAEIQSQPTTEGDQEASMIAIFEKYGEINKAMSEIMLNAQLSTPYGKKLLESEQIATQRSELQQKIQDGIQKQLKQKAISMIPDTNKSPTEQDILKQEQTLSVSELADIARNVVEETVGSIDDVIIAEQRAKQPRHIANLSNIMRIAKLDDTQRASEGADFIMSQLPADIAATIKANPEAMAYIQDAILEGHYCAQDGTLQIYDIHTNGTDVYHEGTNNEVPVFTAPGLKYKMQVLGSGIIDAMKVIGVDHVKYTKDILHASKQTLIESYCMAKRKPITRAESGRDFAFDMNDTSNQSAYDALIAEVKTRVAKLPVPKGNKDAPVDTFAKAAIEFEQYLEVLEDPTSDIASKLTKDDFKNIQKLFDNSSDVTKGYNRDNGDKFRLTRAISALASKLEIIQSHNEVVKNYGDALTFFADGNFDGFAEFAKKKIQSRDSSDLTKSLVGSKELEKANEILKKKGLPEAKTLVSANKTLKTNNIKNDKGEQIIVEELTLDPVRLLLEENSSEAIYEYTQEYIEGLFEPYNTALKGGDQSIIDSEFKKAGALLNKFRKVQETINKESGFEKYTETDEGKPIIVEQQANDTSTIIGAYKANVKHSEYSDKKTKAFKFHESLDLAINSLNYHIEKQYAKFELDQQLVNMKNAIGDSSYEINTKIAISDIKTKVGRISMQSRGLMRKIDNAAITDKIKRETNDFIFDRWETGIDIMTSYVDLLRAQIEDPAIIQDHMMALDTSYTKIYKVDASGKQILDKNNKPIVAKIFKQKEINGNKVFTNGTDEFILTDRAGPKADTVIALDKDGKDVIVNKKGDALLLKVAGKRPLQPLSPVAGPETHKNDLPGFVDKMDKIQAKINLIGGFKKGADGEFTIDPTKSGLQDMINAAKESIIVDDKNDTKFSDFETKCSGTAISAAEAILMSSTKIIQVLSHNYYPGLGTKTKTVKMQEFINNKAVLLYEQPQKLSAAGEKLYMDRNGNEVTVEIDYSFKPPITNTPVYKYEIAVIDTEGNPLYRDRNGNTTSLALDESVSPPHTNELQTRSVRYIPETAITPEMTDMIGVQPATKIITTIEKPNWVGELDNKRGGTGLDNKFAKHMLEQVGSAFKLMMKQYKAQDPNINASNIARKGMDIRYKVYAKTIREILAIDKGISVFNDGIAQPITSKGTTNESKFIYNGISDLVEFFGGYKKKAGEGDVDGFEFNKIFEGEEYRELNTILMDIKTDDYVIDPKTGDVVFIGEGSTLSKKRVNFINSDKVSISKILRDQIISKLPPELTFNMGNDVTSFIRGIYGKMFVVETGRIMEYVENQLKLGHTNRGTLDWFVKMMDFLGGKGDPITARQRKGLKTEEQIKDGDFFSLDDIKSRGPQGLEIAGIIKGSVEDKMGWYMANSMSSLHNRFVEYKDRPLTNLGSDFDALMKGMQDYDDDLYTCMAMMKMINGGTAGASNMSQAEMKPLLKEDMFQSDTHKTTVFGNRFVMDEGLLLKNVGGYNKHGDIVDASGAIKIKKANLIRERETNGESRSLLAVFKQIMNESQWTIRMSEAYQYRTDLTNLEKSIEDLMRQADQVFTGSYFLDANQDYQRAQYTPNQKITQAVNSANQAENSTATLINRLVALKENYDSKKKEGGKLEELAQRYDKMKEGALEGESYFHPYYVERIDAVMNKMDRTLSSGAAIDSRANQSTLFPGMDKFSDIKDNKLRAQTVMADHIVNTINRIGNNIGSLNAKKKITHAEFMSIYKLVGNCFNQLVHTDIQEGLYNAEVQKSVASLTDKDGFFNKFFDLYSSSYTSSGLSQRVGGKDRSTIMQQEKTAWSKTFQMAKSLPGSATIKIWQSFLWRADHFLFYTGYGGNKVNTDVLARSSREWFFSPEEYNSIGTVEQLGDQTYIDRLFDPIIDKDPSTGLSDLMSYNHATDIRKLGDDVDIIRRVLGKRNGIPKKQYDHLNKYLSKLSELALTKATEAPVNEVKENYLAQKEKIDALLRDYFNRSIEIAPVKEITDGDVIWNNIIGRDRQRYTTEKFQDLILKDDAAIAKREEDRQKKLGETVDKAIGTLPVLSGIAGKAITMTSSIIKSAFEGGSYNGASWLYAIAMMFKQDNTNLWEEFTGILSQKQGMGKWESFGSNSADVAQEALAVIGTMIVYRWLFTRLSNPRSYGIPLATWTMNDLIADMVINKETATGVSYAYTNTWGNINLTGMADLIMNTIRTTSYEAQGLAIPDDISDKNKIKVERLRGQYDEAWTRMLASGEYRWYIGERIYEDAEEISAKTGNSEAYQDYWGKENSKDRIDLFASLFESAGGVTQYESYLRSYQPAVYVQYQTAWLNDGKIKQLDYFKLAASYEKYGRSSPQTFLNHLNLVISGRGAQIDMSAPASARPQTNNTGSNDNTDGPRSGEGYDN